MSEGKLLITGCIIKKDKPFRARHIVQETGLTPQVVNYHLKEFVKKGLLDQTDIWYSIIDKDQVINTFVDTGINKHESSKLHHADMLDKHKVDLINESIKFYLAFKTFKLPNVNVLRLEILRLIDEAMNSLEKGRRYVNTAGMAESTAKSILLKKDANDWWKVMGETLAKEMSKVEFEEFFTELAERLRENE